MKHFQSNDDTYEDLLEDSSDDPLSLVPSDLVYLIPGFLDRRMQDVREVRDLLARNQFEDISAIGHKLKGTGLGFGFPLVTDIGRELEIAANAEDRVRIGEWITELSSFVESLKGLLNFKKSTS